LTDTTPVTRYGLLNWQCNARIGGSLL